MNDYNEQMQNDPPDKRTFGSPENAVLNDDQWRFLQMRYHMTPREVEIAKLICRGLSNEEIAESLNIRYGTVKTHIRNIYRRIHVKSKVAMLLRFIDDTKGRSNECSQHQEENRHKKTG